MVTHHLLLIFLTLSKAKINPFDFQLIRIDHCLVEVFENRIRQENVWREKQLLAGNTREKKKRNNQRKDSSHSPNKKWKNNELTDEVPFNYLKTFKN